MLQVQSLEGTLQLDCRGSIIAGEECEALQAALTHLLAAEGRERVVVDLQHIRKLDCAGLGVLASCALRARELGKSLELASVPFAVQTMLRMTGLDAVLLPQAIGGPSSAPLRERVSAAQRQALEGRR